MTADRAYAVKVHINILPDDALLRVFDLYVDGTRDEDAWHTLVHVCQRWRFIVFESPRRLNLQLVCTENRLVRVMLDIWAALPMIVCILGSGHQILGESMDNIISALEYNDRICRISLCARGSLLERLAEAMQESFPELMFLKLRSNDVSAPVLSETFLGGSAPRLQSLYLDSIPCPTLPKLLLSASDLVDLCLLDIPPSGYIAPEVMVTCLTAMTKLGTLELVFRSPRSLPDEASRHPPLQTCAVLPTLTSLVFLGDSEYLEDILERIDAPLLDHVLATFFHQPILDTPQLLRFISRTEAFQAPILVDVVLVTDFIAIILSRKIGTLRMFTLRILCPQPDLQLSALIQVWNSSSPQFSTLEQLKIYDYSSLLNQSRWLEDVQDIQWLRLLRLFATEESGPIRTTCVACCACPSRPLRGRSNRCVTCTTKSLHRGDRATGTYPGSHWEVRRRETALRPPCSCPLLGSRVVNVESMLQFPSICHLLTPLDSSLHLFFDSQDASCNTFASITEFWSYCNDTLNPL